MTVLRAECAWWADSPNPADVMIITPHFQTTTPGVILGTDAEALASDLADALNTWSNLTAELHVKMYDAQHAAPNYPLAEEVRRQGSHPSAAVNRDLAACLSFFAGTNRPRRRGRLYVPCAIKALAAGAAQLTAANMNTIATLVPILTGLGGVDVDWVVYSRVDNQAHAVTDWFVDNQWDTQRRRGLRASTRLVGTTSEGDLPNLVSLVPGVEPAGADQIEPLENPYASEAAT